MSLETRKSSTSVIVIRAKGTILHFTIREFALVTGLNCAANKDEFVFDEECPNKIIDQYFDGESFVQKKGLFAIVSDKIWGNDNNEDALIVANLYFIHAFLPNDNNEDALIFADLYFIHAFLLSSVDTVVIPHLHFNLVESDRYSDYLWGSIAFEELARSLHSKLKPKGKFYMLLGMPLAIQIWLYECCSNVPRNVAFKVDSQIPRILNWKTNSPHPRYETLMGSMFDDTNDKLTTKKKFHGDSSASPAKKKLKPHPKGVDEQIAKRTPPPRSAKIPFARTPIHKPIQTKVTLHGNRKDINRPDIKKSISVQSPTPSSFSSEDEDGVVSKKVFDKFCEKVWQEFNDVCGLVSSRFDQMMNAINENKKQAKGSESDQPPMDENVKSTSPHQATTKFVHEFNKNPEGTLVVEEMAGYQSNSMNDVYIEIDGYNEDNDIVLNTKTVDESIGEAQISESQFTFSDDVLRSIDLDSITKANVEVEDEFKIFIKFIQNKEGAIEMNVNTPAEHESEVNDVDNSKLDQQHKSAVHIPAGVNDESNADQDLSDSQITLSDELLPSLNAYVNLE
ncbi:hypothetical protein FXO38_05885 [Capsicum annuum]|nr:hypothetical protein FXO38_05885 [Capsicum annuum]